ncbi:hypothetical protein CSKR_110814 [Clonorchis sinensis]|uniref:Uncharacterized protein n=1 Tax=Clonorchis sinensis TaxID=79923 RepID=A0A419PJ53_CLOSI|nr:hypothetical protein CSKR_110814 [Clonorchis sinensis]
MAECGVIYDEFYDSSTFELQPLLDKLKPELERTRWLAQDTVNTSFVFLLRSYDLSQREFTWYLEKLVFLVNSGIFTGGFVFQGAYTILRWCDAPRRMHTALRIAHPNSTVIDAYSACRTCRRTHAISGDTYFEDLWSWYRKRRSSSF